MAEMLNISDIRLYNLLKAKFGEKEAEDFVSLIKDAKQTLVNKNILDLAVINNKVNPQDAHHQENFDWRYLSMAAVL